MSSPISEIAPRLAAVLKVIHLVFNEDYMATRGERRLRETEVPQS